jgi:hypothetical protein
MLLQKVAHLLLCVLSASAFLSAVAPSAVLRCQNNHRHRCSLTVKAYRNDCQTGSQSDERGALFGYTLRQVTASLLLMTAPVLINSLPAMAAEQMQQQPFSSPTVLMSMSASDKEGGQGLSAVTQSELGRSIRSSVVGGAKLVDQLDLKWERFSDSLRDEAKCDPLTNRRRFDNGVRRDGTPIGNPVLGALCTPEPLQDLDEATVQIVLKAGRDAALTTWKIDPGTLQKKQEQVQQLVGPAFSRAAVSSVKDTTTSTSSTEHEDGTQTQAIKRQAFNRDLYTNLRAFGEVSDGNTNNNRKESARLFERSWGDKLLANLAPNANRNDFVSPFPKPDDTENQPYDEGALLDALGGVSVALSKLQQGGVVGHWEISIPEDDNWNVVTIAVDNDISIGGQILARERQQPLGGSEVVALVRAALEHPANISYKMDTFFIDPSTTRQELYNPTQLLISVSDLGQ